MERIATVEERIRRAEQIYARRQGLESKEITINRNKNKQEKKDIKLLKKMVIQIIICILIAVPIYVIQNHSYPFSDDCINKIKEVLSYDTNFVELYNIGKNKIRDIYKSIFKTKETKNQESNQEQKASEHQEQTQEQNENVQNGIGGATEEKAENAELSQTEQDILKTKETTTFVKPIEGTITSKFGQRDTATGKVPKHHTGTDIAANIGTKIKAATEGEVVLASEEGDYGKHLKIQIGEVSIIYAHCNNLYVKQGDKVTQGQEIAEVGTTGNSTRTTFAL
ncbi:MAG: M23 family metallopeptidase [Clostridiales bacterium]|nr:M23 family metallopeptidase [Clostridiales bacterium]